MKMDCSGQQLISKKGTLILRKHQHVKNATNGANAVTRGQMKYVSKLGRGPNVDHFTK